MSEPAACDCPTCTEAAARPGMAQVTHVESSAAQGRFWLVPATSRRNHSAFGSKRERQVAEKLRAEGWVVFHNKASRGVCDLVALRSWEASGTEPVGRTAQLVEVKGTTRSPWVAWGPAERAELVAAAKQAGAVPMLAWWPPHGELKWIGEAEWPA